MSNSRYIAKLADRLFTEQNSREAFSESLNSPKDFPSAIIWLGKSSCEIKETIFDREVWQPDFIERVPSSIKLGNSNFHQEGDIYILDFSSVFEASILKGVESQIKLILDVCSAPGGKAVFAWRLFQPELILCNEVINKRCKALISNLKRCKITPAAITGYDSSVLSKRYNNIFDLVIVDAPCSGQSLIAKGEENPGSFHPLTIKRNASRQRRIIANSQNCVSSGGYLAYMTCTYSIEENEGVLEWFLKKFPDYTALNVSSLNNYLSPHSKFPCYRMFPHDGLGAGGFTALLKKDGDISLESYDFSAEKFFWRSFN